MNYKIIIDKQSRINPSEEKKEYVVDIEELRAKGNIYDSLIVTKDEDYVLRRLKLTEFHVLNVLDAPIKEELPGLNIELFEGDNYIYLVDMTENRFYGEYIIKNEFTDEFVTKNEMNSSINSTAKSIELNVNQKLDNYSTTEEMNSAIEMESDKINIEVKKKVSNADYTSAQILAMINGDESEVVIKGDKVDINGKKVKFITSVIDNYYYTNEDCEKVKVYVTNQGTLTDDEIEALDTNGDGVIRATDYMRIKNAIEQNNGYLILEGSFQINPENIKRTIIFRDKNGKIVTSIGFQGMTTQSMSVKENFWANSVVTDNLSTDGFKKSDCGKVSITPSAANTPTGKAITFNTSFSSTPVVVTSADSSVPGTTVLGTGASGKSKTGCTVYVTRKNTTNTNIEWIAMQES